MMQVLLGPPRAPRLLIVAILVVALPCVYVWKGKTYNPFAEDVANEPERYEGRVVLLVLNQVVDAGPGWIELGHPPSRFVADERFGIEKGEVLNVKVAVRDGRAEVVEVGRHSTRGLKWLVSFPVLLAVALLVVVRVRLRLRAGGLVPIGRSDA